jgi:glyoxylase-like metal-dependent hydrolase (beta-lactamase superfamily II)
VAGDLVQVDQYPYFGDPTTDMKKWLSTFKKWQNLSVKKVCPGHGRVVDPGYIKLMENYFLSLIAKLKDFKKQGMSVNQVVRHPDLPPGYWGDEVPRPVWYDYCIALLYRKLQSL